MRKIMNIPIAGMRVIKTALAVFLCLVIADFMNSPQYTYAAIVAIVCMQKDWDNSIDAAVKRIIATIFGIVFGYFTYKSIGWLNIQEYIYIRYGYTAVMMIFLVNILIILEKHDVTSVACIVFIGVATIHEAEMDAGHFAIVRMLDTFVGIGVSLIVNVTVTESIVRKVKGIHGKLYK